jgi:hypothetical protein
MEFGAPRVTPARREQPRHWRDARHTGAERYDHRVRASDIGSRPLVRYGQNDRSIAITRKNFLFLGSEAGERATILYTVLETVKRPPALDIGSLRLPAWFLDPKTYEGRTPRSQIFLQAPNV